MKNKVLAAIVLATLATAGLVGTTSANFGPFAGENRTEIRELMEKVKSGETLTKEEQAKLDELKSQIQAKGFTKGRDGVMKGLTTEEKTALQSMTTEERQAFFDQRRAERQAEMEVKRAEREVHEAIIDKLINDEILTADEQVILDEIKQKRAERQKQRALMEKVKSGEELSSEEQSRLDELRANFLGRGGKGGGFSLGMHR